MVAVYNGILLGLFLSMFVGATFFLLIETSINRGFKPALAMNIGVFLSDITIIVLAYCSTSEFLNNLVNNNIFRVSGGLAFFGFGSYYILKKHQAREISYDSSLKYTRLILNGLLVNTLNPSVIAFWLGSIVLAVSYNNFNAHQVFIFYLSCISIVIIIDITKIYFASKLKSFINYRILKIVSVITGIIFILLSIRIIFFN